MTKQARMTKAARDIRGLFIRWRGTDGTFAGRLEDDVLKVLAPYLPVAEVQPTKGTTT